MLKKIIVALVIIVIAVGIGFFLYNAQQRPKRDTNNKKETKLTYTALGDSVVAGVGLDEPSDSSACDRTNQAYPNQLSKLRNYEMTNLACSGAKLTNGILQSQEINNLALSPQLDQLFENKKPDIVTITIGANDARWTEIITKCYLSTCGDTQDLVSIKQSLATISDYLDSTLQKIKQQYPKNPPKVYVTGYYQVFPEIMPTECTDLQNISASELQQGRTLLNSLSQTIKATTNNFDTVKFVPLDFSGHELCSQDPWVQGLNAKAPYHTNMQGQKAIAEQISSAIESEK